MHPDAIRTTNRQPLSPPPSPFVRALARHLTFPSPPRSPPIPSNCNNPAVSSGDRSRYRARRRVSLVLRVASLSLFLPSPFSSLFLFFPIPSGRIAVTEVNFIYIPRRLNIYNYAIRKNEIGFTLSSATSDIVIHKLSAFKMCPDRMYYSVS